MPHTLARLSLPPHADAQRLAWLTLLHARRVPVRAFGFESLGLRLLLAGRPEDHHRSMARLHPSQVALCALPSDVTDSVTWVHRAPAQRAPLDSPWTSHWDLCGLRQAPWFDARALGHLVDAEVVRQRLGADPALPRPVPSASLPQLLWSSAHALGCLPGDRAAFAAFVQLAQSRGWRNPPLAKALCVSQRRVRQLASESKVDLAHVQRALRAKLASDGNPDAAAR